MTASTKTTIFLITGANRGLGRGIADSVLSRPHHTVIGLVRDPSHETSQSLVHEQTKATGSRAIVIQYDASDPWNSASAALKELASTHPDITHLDVVVANAGSIGFKGKAVDASIQDYMDNFLLHTLAPLYLFKAALPYLSSPSPSPSPSSSAATAAAATSSKFIAISSQGGSIASIPLMSHAAAPTYGAAKTAQNHLICRLNQEHPTITFGLLTPGATRTGFAGKDFDWSKLPHVRPLEDVVPGIMNQIDSLERTGKQEGKGLTGAPAGFENVKFRDFEGKIIPW